MLNRKAFLQGNNKKDPILVVENLVKKFGDFTAVNDLSFSVERGEIFGLLGPNGAGKSTTISMLSCLLPVTSGNAYVNGFSVTRDSYTVKGVIGVVPQDIALYETLSAKQNLRYWGHMYNIQGRQLTNRISELLEQFNLADRANEPVKNFSGGMKRRLNIAVGLIHHPKLLFLDEPTVGIDPQSRRSILDRIKILREEGITTVYTTHYMQEAEELSDTVGIIDHGKLIAMGSQSELKKMVGAQEMIKIGWNLGVGNSFPDLIEEIKQQTGVINVSTVDEQLLIRATKSIQLLPNLLELAQHRQERISTIEIIEPNLEAVFLELTGRALRD